MENEIKNEVADDGKYVYKRNEEQIRYVEVPLPSGNVFLMEQPSRFTVLFELNSLPTALTEKAIDAWQSQGIGNESEAADAQLQAVGEEFSRNAEEEDKLKVIKLGLKMRDAVLRLSHKPKLVVGPARNPGELSTEDVTDEDLDFLFKWVASGGRAGDRLAQFRGAPAKDALASAIGPPNGPEAELPAGAPGGFRG